MTTTPRDFVAEVRAQHGSMGSICSCCGQFFPCETIRALDQQAAALDALRTELAAVKEREGNFKRLALEMRDSMSCEYAYHKKSERHGLGEPCKVLARIDAALTRPEVGG